MFFFIYLRYIRIGEILKKIYRKQFYILRNPSSYTVSKRKRTQSTKEKKTIVENIKNCFVILHAKSIIYESKRNLANFSLIIIKNT